MAIVQGPSPIPGGRSATQSEDYRVSYERKFLVVTDNIADDETVVCSTLGIAMQSAHPSDAHAYVVGINAQEGERITLASGTHGCQWEITVNYGYLSPQELHPSGDPLSQPIRVSFNSEKHERICLLSWDVGDLTLEHPTLPVVNSVGDFFDPPLVMDSFRGTLTIERNEAFPASLADLAALSNRTNLFPIWGFASYTLKSAPIKFPPKEVDQVSGVEFYPMVYEFEFLPESWAETVYNTGYRQKKSGKLVKILDDAGDELNQPGFLSSDGAYLPPAVDPGDIVTMTVHKYRPLDYSIFGFPSTLG